MPDLSGFLLGRYHLIEPLGEGGMATVYKGFDTTLECEVAVKVIRTERFSQEILSRALKRFEREAKSVARLTHANIVKVTDYGEHEGSPYLVMEYLPGGTLKDLIKDHRQLPWREAARLLIPIADALSYAHSQGVIHRDIKPSNILLTQSGQPTLTDFGVAKIIEDEATQDLTGTSATVGTPEYMAPEQIVSKTVDNRADLYALGVVYYELITGRRPYEADTPMTVLFKHASEPLPRPSQFVKGLPQHVENFLIKILAKSPEDRYQSGDEVVKALQDLSQKEVAVGKATKHRLWLRWLVAGLGVIAMLGGVWLAKLLAADISDEQPTGIASIAPLAKPITTISTTLEPTSTPAMTQTPINSETPTVTLTPTAVIITGVINKNANCREGPASYYKTSGIINGGTSVELIGSDTAELWMYARIIKSSGYETTTTEQTCWISKDLITVDEDTSNLPFLTPIPPNYYVYSLKVWYTKLYKEGIYPLRSDDDHYRDYSYRITNIISESRASELGILECKNLEPYKSCTVQVYGPDLRNVSDGWEIRIDD